MMEKWLAHVSDLELWRRYTEITALLDNKEMTLGEAEALWSEWDVIAAELERRYPIPEEDDESIE